VSSAQKLLQELARSSNVRSSIQNIFATDPEHVDVPMAVRLFQKYPDCSDLLILLPENVRSEVASLCLSDFPTKTVEAMVSSGMLSNPSQTLANSILNRLRVDEDLLAPLAAKLGLDGRIDLAVASSFVADHIKFLRILFSHRGHENKWVAIASFIGGMDKSTIEFGEISDALEAELSLDDTSSVPVEVIQCLGVSYTKVALLFERGILDKAKLVLDRLVARAQSIPSDIRIVSALGLLLDKSSAKVVLGMDGVGALSASLLAYKRLGSGFVGKKDLQVRLSRSGKSEIEWINNFEITASAMSALGYADLVSDASKFANFELVFYLLRTDRLDQKLPQVKFTIMKAIKSNVAKAKLSGLYLESEYSDLINELISTLLSDRKANDAAEFLDYRFISLELKKLAAKQLRTCDEDILKLPSVVTFFENASDLFSDDDLGELREEALQTLDSAFALFKHSAVGVIKDRALTRILSSSRKSKEVLFDKEIALNEVQIISLLRAIGDFAGVHQAVLNRIKSDEITVGALPETLQLGVIRIVFSELISDAEATDDSLVIVGQRLTNQSLHQDLDNESAILQRLVSGELPKFSRLLKDRGLFLEIIFSQKNVRALELSEEELKTAIESAKMIPAATATELFSTWPNLVKIAVLERLDPLSIQNPQALFKWLQDSSEKRYFVELVLKAYNSNPEHDAALLKFVIDHDLSVLLSHARTLSYLGSEEIVNELLQTRIGRECLVLALEIIEDDLRYKVSATLLDTEYSSAVARAIIERIADGCSMLSMCDWTAAMTIFKDKNLTDKEKELALSDLDAEVAATLVQMCGLSVEKFRLRVGSGWPSQQLTNTQIEILNNLGPNEEDERIRVAFLAAVGDDEVRLSVEALAKLEDDDLYLLLVELVDNKIFAEGYIAVETLEAFMATHRRPKLKSLHLGAIAMKRDLSKLDDESQVLAISHLIGTRPECFVLDKEGTKITYLNEGLVMGLVRDGELVLTHLLESLPTDDHLFLKRILKLAPTLPDTVTGDFHARDGKFIPHDRSFPIADVTIQMEILGGAIEGLLRISGSAVIKDLEATKKGSIVYSVVLDQQDVLEMLSQQEEMIAKARKIHDRITKLKKETSKFLDSLKGIEESADRKFGIELEIASSISRDELAKRLGRRTQSTDEYRSNDGWASWSVKYDQSIVTEENGLAVEAELVSPVLCGRRGLEEVRLVLRRLNKIASDGGVELEVGERTNTGLHVHHSIEDLISRVGEISEQSEAAIAMGKYMMSIQGALYALCSKWRLQSKYARPLENSQELIHSRYGFTVTDYGTLEYRLKEATFNVDSIVRWVIMTQQITVSLIQRINMDMASSKEKLKEALSSGVELLLIQEFEEAGKSRPDILSHLTFYQAAAAFALAA
jgi:hypothetical protein